MKTLSLLPTWIGLTVALTVVQALSAANPSMRLGANFWAYVHHNPWSGVLPWKYDSQDLHLWQSLDFSENHWNPEFLNDIAIYSVLRFMDWNRTNGSPVKTWSDRTLPHQTQTAPFGDGNLQQTGAQPGGFAYEWIIDLCNRTGQDLWLTIPQLTITADDIDGLRIDYAHKLALLIRHGVDLGTIDLHTIAGIDGNLARLNSLQRSDLLAAGGTPSGRLLLPGLRVWVEYANETWNSSFTAYSYCGAEGKKLGFSNDANLNQFKFHAWAAARLWQAFEDVFGAERPRRVVRVLAGNRRSTWGMQRQFEVINDPSRNPFGQRPDKYAIAAYFYKIDAQKYPGDAPFETLIEVADASIGEVKTMHQALAATAPDVVLTSYEGGPHFVEAASFFASRPDAYNIMMHYLAGVSDYLEIFNQYTHSGSWSPGDAWGAKEFDGQPLADAPKYRALFDWFHAIPSLDPGLKVPLLVTISGGNLQFTFPTLPGFFYKLERSLSLGDGSWEDTGPPAQFGEGTTSTFTLSVPAAEAVFYRLVVLP